MAMNCVSFAELVHSLVRYELLDLDLREQAMLHADGCAECAARLATAQALADATEFARASLYAEQAPQRVSAALMAEYRRAHEPRRVGMHAARWALAAAAVVALSFGGWFAFEHLRTNDRVEEPQPARASSVTVQANAESGNANATQQAAASPDSSLLADFEPVPFAGDFDPNDPSMIVHVQLTRAALGKLGYEVEKGKGKEVVEADVLVGVDGWPRAVRVSQ
jgi:hypothetical protein